MKQAPAEPTCWGDPLRVSFGNNCNLVNTLFNTASGDITIGSWVIFGHNCMVLTGTHDVMKKDAERQDYPRSGRDIVIGDGVWIGSGAIILGPCRIGDYAVIGAGSVVRPGVYEAGYLYAGSPAVTKRRVI